MDFELALLVEVAFVHFSSNEYMTLMFMKELIEDNVYEFRVYAVNKVGDGPVGPTSEPITAKDPWGTYRLRHRLVADDIRSSFMFPTGLSVVRSVVKSQRHTSRVPGRAEKLAHPGRMCGSSDTRPGCPAGCPAGSQPSSAKKF